MRRGSIWIAAVASVLLVALWSTQQTGALWRDRAQISGGTITSGSLTILAQGSQDYTWSNFGGTNLSRGSVVQQPLTVTVEGDVEARYRLQAVQPGSPQLPIAVTAWIVRSADACPTSSGGAVAAPVSTVDGPWTAFPAPGEGRSAAPGTTEVWCLRATVGADAAQGASTALALEFRVEQKT
ncbi:hypothetical protein [Rhodococcus sp. CH91]|uniref:hypothetical protein n=1 Tax=Rhodococcus sp. CH91 TaxID=2910256 RepID=UPI001F4A537B|nr:hypothetical protein [Rhodococcus sp. CH91]